MRKTHKNGHNFKGKIKLGIFFLKKLLFLAKTQGMGTWEGMLGKSVWMGVNGGWK